MCMPRAYAYWLGADRPICKACEIPLWKYVAGQLMYCDDCEDVTPCPLLDVPTEIRMLIYDQLLPIEPIPAARHHDDTLMGANALRRSRGIFPLVERVSATPAADEEDGARDGEDPDLADLTETAEEQPEDSGTDENDEPGTEQDNSAEQRWGGFHNGWAWDQEEKSDGWNFATPMLVCGLMHDEYADALYGGKTFCIHAGLITRSASMRPGWAAVCLDSTREWYNDSGPMVLPLVGPNIPDPDDSDASSHPGLLDFHRPEASVFSLDQQTWFPSLVKKHFDKIRRLQLSLTYNPWYHSMETLDTPAIDTATEFTDYLHAMVKRLQVLNLRELTVDVFHQGVPDDPVKTLVASQIILEPLRLLRDIPRFEVRSVFRHTRFGETSNVCTLPEATDWDITGQERSPEAQLMIAQRPPLAAFLAKLQDDVRDRKSAPRKLPPIHGLYWKIRAEISRMKSSSVVHRERADEMLDTARQAREENDTQKLLRIWKDVLRAWISWREPKLKYIALTDVSVALISDAVESAAEGSVDG